MFACGNVLQVHDLVDFVSEESEIAGRYAAKYVLGGKITGETLSVEQGENVSYVCPQRIEKNVDGNVKLFFRATNTFANCTIKVTSGDEILHVRKKKIVVPGEMETVILPSAKWMKAKDTVRVSVGVEE